MFGRPIVAVIFMAVIALGCDGSTKPTPNPVDAIDSAAPTMPSADNQLEATLPDIYEGEALRKFSLRGDDAVRGDSTTLAIIAAAGRTVDDFSVGGAVSEMTGMTFLAIRLRGSSEQVLRDLFEQSASEAGDTIETVQLGGRTVYKSSGPSRTGSVYYYVRDEFAFGLNAPDDTTAERGLAVLP